MPLVGGLALLSLNLQPSSSRQETFRRRVWGGLSGTEQWPTCCLGPECTQGPRVNGRHSGLNSARPSSRSSLSLADSCPYLGHWPHYPKVREREFLWHFVCATLCYSGPLFAENTTLLRHWNFKNSQRPGLRLLFAPHLLLTLGISYRFQKLNT